MTPIFTFQGIYTPMMPSGFQEGDLNNDARVAQVVHLFDVRCLEVPTPWVGA